MSTTPPTNILVKDFMTTSLVTLTEDVDALSAMRTLLHHRISGAPVLDAQGNFLGIFSEKTAISFLLGLAYDQLVSTHIGAFMSTDMNCTISEEADLLMAAQIFQSTDFRRLPVLRGKKLVGQISRRDVLRAALKIIDDHPHYRERSLLYLSALVERDDSPF